MKMTEIRHRAKSLEIKNYSRLAKADLIRTIQTAEGNEPCFARITDCGQLDCCWLPDCQGRSL